MKQKVRTIAFLELLFRCGKDERSLPFQKIADECKVDKDTVEILVMKAMSLQLVRGVIDQVEELAHIDWIQPRYLNMGHIRTMADKLRDWEDKMTNIIHIVDDKRQQTGL